MARYDYKPIPKKAIGGVIMGVSAAYQLGSGIYSAIKGQKEAKEMKARQDRTNRVASYAAGQNALSEYNDNLGEVGFYRKGGMAPSGNAPQTRYLAPGVEEVDANNGGTDTVPLKAGGKTKAMVDDNEVIVNVGDGRQLIFSDDLGYADAAKKLSLAKDEYSKKLLKFEGKEHNTIPNSNVVKRYKDRLAEIDQEIAALFLEQEEAKAAAMGTTVQEANQEEGPAAPRYAAGGVNYLPSAIGGAVGATSALLQKGPQEPSKLVHYRRNPNYNIAPQLGAVTDFERSTARDINARVNSGTAAVALGNSARATALREKGKLYAAKENAETTIRNQNAEDKQRIDNMNKSRYDQYAQARTDFNNQRTASLFGTGIQTAANIDQLNTDQKKMDQQADFIDRKMELADRELDIIEASTGDTSVGTRLRYGMNAKKNDIYNKKYDNEVGGEMDKFIDGLNNDLPENKIVDPGPARMTPKGVAPGSIAPEQGERTLANRYDNPTTTPSKDAAPNKMTPRTGTEQGERTLAERSKPRVSAQLDRRYNPEYGTGIGAQYVDKVLKGELTIDDIDMYIQPSERAKVLEYLKSIQ